MRRVLLLSQEFPPETGWGGIGTYAAVIAPAMAQLGLEVHVLSVVPGQAASDTLVGGAHLHRRPLRRPRGVGRIARVPRLWNRLSLAACVAWEARRLGLDFDVCESPEWQAEGLVIGLEGRVPLVVRLHSGAAQVNPFRGDRPFDARLADLVERTLIRRADVVTGTATIIDEVAPALGIVDVRRRPIIYPVVLPEQVPESVTEPIVVFAGRFEPRKGPDRLVRAMPTILSAIPEARFVLVGTDTGDPGGGSHLERLRANMAASGVEHAVTVSDGRVPGAVERGIASAAVCVMPSRWESFGYVAAEAAGLERPVVAADIPSLRQIVENEVTGLLVSGDDGDVWANAVISLLQDRGRARAMGRAGRERMAHDCNPARIASLTIDAYELAISRHSR